MMAERRKEEGRDRWRINSSLEDKKGPVAMETKKWSKEMYQRKACVFQPAQLHCFALLQIKHQQVNIRVTVWLTDFQSDLLLGSI